MSETYNAVFYRNSNYSSAEEAKQKHALYAWEETYGYGSTMDAFLNSLDLLHCYDNTAIDEFRFIWTIDDVTFPEMDHIQSRELLNASYDGFSKHKDVLSTGKKK
jgi:hypothetical protein